MARSSLVMSAVVGCLLVLAFFPTRAEALNPITRVAELLEGLAKKIELDGKAEEELFEKYRCWYKTVVSTKQASNAAAKDRIEALTAYIADIEAGRIEFTTERTDLEKQLADINAELEKAKDLREKEHEDYLAAKDEMQKAIAALERAVEVLATATSSKEALLSAAFDVRKALALGRSMGLSDRDAKFLERALNAEMEPPHSMDGKTKDWKKLNRKATFKMKYKARSGKIQEILADMLQTFQDNLAEAEQKESEAQASYEKLRASKLEEKAATEQALQDMTKEGSARALSKDEAQAEVDALTEQVANDEKYIAEAEASYATKLEEWKERKRLRTEEIASISKAISILRSDDARDLFKKSFESQGGSMALLQEGDSRCSPARRQRKAADMMRMVSGRVQSVRLAAIATAISMSTTGHFDEVIAKIDEMISTLAEEEAADLEKKEQCEKDRMENTKKAKKLSQEIDDKSAFIERKEAEIEELKKKIKEAVEQIAELEKQLAAATENRAAEKAEYETNKADDESAVELIEQAIGVLQEFYEKNGLVFMQGREKPEMSAAGEAPPPPPSTWEEPYGGAKGETNGIVAILELIKEDIQKDIATATAEEEAAQKAYDEFKVETETQISNLEAQKAQWEEEIGDAEGAITDAQSQRADMKKILEDTIAFLKDIAPGCDFIAVNFEIRQKNRQAERDGLEKAKAILQGAEFGGFLQRGHC